MRTAFSLAFVGLGTLLGGCVFVEDVSPRADPPPRCAQLAENSIRLNVFVRDELGAPICDATVSVRDGASVRELPSYTVETPSCGWYGLPARPGAYEVIASKPGYVTAVQTYVVAPPDADGCRVGGGVVTFELARAAADGCTEIAVPSFDVDVRDELGRPACDATVVVRDGAFRAAIVGSPAPGGGCQWQGPYERPGTYEVTVSKPGYETEVFPNVLVATDAAGCHVLPAKVRARLEPAGAGCTGQVVEPFDLDVRDETFAEVCDASVLVFEGGSLVASLEPRAGADGDCAWTGGPDRAGVYDLQVTKPGYLTSQVNSVAVALDAAGCHAVPVLVNVKLAPAVAGSTDGG